MNSITTRYDYILALLGDLVNQISPIPTVLIVCSTKGDFLEQVIAELDSQHAEIPHGPLPREENDGQPNETTSSQPSHVLLSTTLRFLNASQYVNLVFCPTITVLRGYLSGYAPKPIPISSDSSSVPNQIIILNLLAMHHGTSEFTLQGLSQTFATLISAAYRTSLVLKLVECKDINDPSHPNRGSALWQTEVPLLSGSIKISEGGASWGRRTISLMRIASRWFRVQDEKG